jgi:predicted glycosyltransferase
VRIWIDMTAPAHPVFFRPIIRILREHGHDVVVTARDYADTLGLLRLHGIDHVAFGRHGGARRTRKLAELISRSLGMRRFGRRRGFDLALGHGSNDLALAAAALRIPALNTFDYEFATFQHHIGCRLARRVMVPDRIPPERLRRYGVSADKLVQYPGLKEEYYLADFEPDPSVLDRLGLDQAKVIVVLRPPPAVSLYHRRSNPLYRQVLEYVSTQAGVQAIVLPRTPAQRAELRSLSLRHLVVPQGPVDAQSLIALADLVVSAGGTMNREAVALGTPVYTTYAARLGGVDEALMHEGRLQPLSEPRAMELVKRPDRSEKRVRRDPAVLARLMLETVG